MRKKVLQLSLRQVYFEHLSACVGNQEVSSERGPKVKEQGLSELFQLPSRLFFPLFDSVIKLPGNVYDNEM